MKVSAFLVLSIVIFFFSCQDGIITDVSEVTQAQVLMITSSSENENIHNLELRVYGTCDGSFVIENDTFEAGEFDRIIYNHDYYTSSIELNYIPLGIKSGDIKIKSTFAH